jgi:hypothetical protein
MTGRAETDAGAQVNPALIEAIARRVAELIRAELGPPSRLLTPSDVAAQFGVSRAWVYAHADELGAVRLGTGPKARLRFDASRLTSAISLHASNGRARLPRKEAQCAADLLPIYGRGQRA